MKTGILICGLVVMNLACASHRPVRGWISRAEVGEAFLDFRFVDDEGVARSLRNQLGDYTILALTRCEKDTHGPAVDVLGSIVAEHRRAGFVEVVGVDVHWSEHGCVHEGECHLVDKQRDLASICDATGAVGRLYYADKVDRLFLIGPGQKIILTSTIHETENLRRRLREGVAALSKLRADRLAQEYGDVSFGQ